MPVQIEASIEELRRARDLLRRRDELLIAQGAQAVVHRDFTPLPHQVPPLGEAGIDWFLWLLAGGRGSGKTDACAYYMNLHAEGPPCLAGAVPHRMAILGPTLGDVSESCVNGPSGLKAHNPAVVERTQKGGTFVLWPNGSIAKEFGAYTPEDTERLRAGGNRSIAEGSLIETATGPRPIETIEAGDLVWTEAGLRPVVWSGSHGERPLWTLTTEQGRELCLTPDHELLVDGMWTRLDHAAVGGTLTAWNMGASAIPFPSGRASSAAAFSRDIGELGSVLAAAGGRFSVPLLRLPACGHASCAAAISSAPPALPPSLAHDRVATISRGSASGRVWDLTVAGEHDFFANGILVANCLAWLEEVAAWRYLKDCWDHVQLGLLRLGPHPHAVGSTTPKNRPTYKKMKALAESTGTLTHATTAQNPHLPRQRREALYETFGGTRLGQRELEGLDIEDVVGALWSYDLLEACRVLPEEVGGLERQRVGVAVDPSWGTTNDEVGIIGGFSCLLPARWPTPGGPLVPHAFIVEDASGRMTPSEWGAAAFNLYRDLDADVLIGEGNFQGEQVRLVEKVAQAETGVLVHFKLVHASRGKVLRAEPVVALYEQGRVHHVGRGLVGLEHQQATWVPPRNQAGDSRDPGDPEDERESDAETSELPSSYSPDRVDALVFLVTELLLGSAGPARMLVPQGVVPTRRVQSGHIPPRLRGGRGR